jgi:hypothetical protein
LIASSPIRRRAGEGATSIASGLVGRPSEHETGFAHGVRPASMPGPVLFVAVGLVVLVLICFLLPAVLDPGSILRRDVAGK